MWHDDSLTILINLASIIAKMLKLLFLSVARCNVCSRRGWRHFRWKLLCTTYILIITSRLQNSFRSKIIWMIDMCRLLYDSWIGWRHWGKAFVARIWHKRILGLIYVYIFVFVRRINTVLGLMKSRKCQCQKLKRSGFMIFERSLPVLFDPGKAFNRVRIPASSSIRSNVSKSPSMSLSISLCDRILGSNIICGSVQEWLKSTSFPLI